DSDILTSLLAGVDPIIEDCPYPPDRPAFDDLWDDDLWDDDPWDADAWNGPWPDDEDGPGPVAPWPDDPEPDDERDGGGVTPGDHDGPIMPNARGGGAEPVVADREAASACAESDMDSRLVGD